MEYSKYQLGVFDWVAFGNGNGLIFAPAGSGKTLTGVKSVNYYPKGMLRPSVVFLAFNKYIRDELASKLPKWVMAKTYHAFGLGAIRTRPTITAYKNSDLLQAHLGRDAKHLFPIISQVTGLFKGNLESNVTHETVNAYIDHYGLDLGDEGEYQFDDIVDGVNYCMKPGHIERLNKIDFDDMIWYPIVRNLPLPKQDLLVNDEVQDVNAAQMELIYRARNGSGRIMGVGDPNQAIYGWRGAGIDSMRILQQKIDAIELPLSLTYRCPLSVVQLVNQLFPHIPFEPWDQAIGGSVNTISEEKMFQQILPGDMVLCRLNAP